MNVLGDECLILARGWWMSEVMNVLGDECLRWWRSGFSNEVVNVGQSNKGIDTCHSGSLSQESWQDVLLIFLLCLLDLYWLCFVLFLNRWEVKQPLGDYLRAMVAPPYTPITVRCRGRQILCQESQFMWNRSDDVPRLSAKTKAKTSSRLSAWSLY